MDCAYLHTCAQHKQDPTSAPTQRATGAPTQAPTQRATPAPTRRATTNPTVAAKEAVATMAAPNVASSAASSSTSMAASVMDVEMAFTYAGDPSKVAVFQRALQAMLQPYGTCVRRCLRGRLVTRPCLNISPPPT